MHYSNLELIIIVLVSVVPAGFLTTYLIAVFNGHVVPDLPYISDTGTYPPESCIFAQILAFGAFLNLLVVFIRYYHVKLCLEKNLKPVSLHRLNYASFITGIASTVGITLVGSFQESNVSTMHFIGAFFAFGGMTAYLWMQTFLSQSLPNIMFSTKRVFLVRIFLLTWSVVLGTLFAVFKKIAAGKFDGKDPYKWLPTDGGFVEHVISTASEWILFVLLMLTFLTFIHDFRRIVVSHPTIKDPLIIEIDSEPSESSPLIS